MREITLCLFLVLFGSSLAAQDAPMPPHHDMNMSESGWTWSPDATVIFGYNYQHRKFTDFSTWESQNWFMLAGQHPLGAGTLTVDGMLSLEPFTIQALGSPQVFQTGEAYHGRANQDRQHPHDLLMGLGARYRIDRGRIGYLFEADLVGAPALGPTPFMHRASSRDNLQAPLSHHNLDSTHITPGVLTAGVVVGELTMEGSWFRGEEPNDNRLDIERPKFDSWSVRGGWRRGPWRAQVSGGHLHRPEVFELFDITRLTASVEFDGTIGGRAAAATIAWGENREIHGIVDSYLVDWTVQTTTRGSFYGRAESTAKDLLDLGGPDPAGFIEFHRISHIQALTIGYIQDLSEKPWGRIGIGADATVYRVSDDLLDPYGSPHSFHVFVRYRPSRTTSAAHIH